MIKAIIIPQFFIINSEANWLLEKKDLNDCYYIECQLPTIPPVGSVLLMDSMRNEIFQQLASQLVRSKNLQKQLSLVRNPDDYYKDMIDLSRLKKISGCSDLEILEKLILDDELETGFSSFTCWEVTKHVFFPNSEYVYIEVKS